MGDIATRPSTLCWRQPTLAEVVIAHREPQKRGDSIANSIQLGTDGPDRLRSDALRTKKGPDFRAFLK
jgi:hypothetical protein